MTSLKTISDSKALIRFAIGVGVIGKINLIILPKLLEDLISKFPYQDYLAGEFVSYILAKFCLPKYQKNTVYLNKLLHMCHETITNKSFRPKIRNTIVLLGWIGKKYPSMEHTSAQQFIDTLVTAITKHHNDASIACYSFLREFLHFSHKGNLLAEKKDSIKRVLTTAKSSDKQNSALLILTLLANECPESVASNASDLMENAAKFISGKDSVLQTSGLRLLIALSPLDPLLYRTKYSSMVSKLLFKTGKLALTVLSVPVFTHFPDTLSLVSSNIVSAVSSLFSSDDSLYHEAGFRILIEFSKSMPLAFGEYSNQIAKTICEAPICIEYANNCKELFQKSNKLWNDVQDSLVKKICNLINTKPFICAKIILNCGDLRKMNYELLRAPFKKLYETTTNHNVKILIPKILIKLTPDRHGPFFSDMAVYLLKSCCNESSREIRLSIIQAFTMPDLEVLALPHNLWYFDVLSNDDDPKVSSAVISLLIQISEYNPMMIYPLFRKVIMDSLFSFSYSNSLINQAQSTIGRSQILRNCQQLLTIYAPCILPFVLDFLKTRIVPHEEKLLDSRLSKLTYFEIESLNIIAEHSIDVIGIICSFDSEQLKQNHSEIMPLFIRILLTYNEEGVELSVLKALILLIDTVGISFIDDMKSLINALYEFGSKTESKILRAFLFKLLGKLGPHIPNSETLDIKDNDILGNISLIGGAITYHDWYLQVVSTALLELLDDETHQSVHFKAAELMSVSLNSTSNIIRPIFERYVQRILKDVYTVPKDEAPRYFSLITVVVSQHADWIKPFATQFSKLMEDMHETTFLDSVLPLVPPIVKCFDETFAPFLIKHIPNLLDIIQNQCIENPERAILAIQGLTPMIKFVYDFNNVIINSLINLLLNASIPCSVIKCCLNSLAQMSVQININPYLSSIFKVFCYLAMSNSYENIKIDLFVLINTIIEETDDKKTSFSTSIDNFCRQHNIAHEATSVAIDDSENDSLELFSPSISISLDENAIISKIRSDNNVSVSQWKDWCTNFISSFITNSPSHVINSCSWISTSDPKFPSKIFHAAFLSCWNQMSYDTKVVVSGCIRKSFLVESGAPITVVLTMVGLCEFMERIEQHLLIPYLEIAAAAKRSEKLAFALYCACKEIQNDARSNKAFETCIDIFSRLSMEDDLKGLIKSNLKVSEMTLLMAEHLRDWNKVVELVKNDNQNVPTLLRAYTNLMRFNEVTKSFGSFEILQGVVKTQTSLSFAKAFFAQQNWRNFEKAMQFAPKESIDSVITSMMGLAKMGKNVTDLEEKGFYLLASAAGPLIPHGFVAVTSSIIAAQELCEISEFSRGKSKFWKERKIDEKLPFEITRPVYENRINLLEGEEKVNELLKFMKNARHSNDWDLHEIFLNRYFPNIDPEKDNPRIILEHIYSQMNRMHIKNYKLLDDLINRLPAGPLKFKIMYKKASFISRMSNTDDIQQHLMEVVDICGSVDSSKAQYLCAWAHIRLYNMKEGDRALHAISAIKSFVKCISLEGKSRLPEVHQLSSILFRSGKFPQVFKSVKMDIESLSIDQWITVTPQIFAQMDHGIPEIRKFVLETISRMLMKHHHSTLFSLLYAVTNDNNTAIAGELLKKFEEDHFGIVQGAKTFHKGLIRACTTKVELWADAMSAMTVPLKTNNMRQMRAILNPLIDDLSYPQTDDDRAFAKDYGQIVKSLAIEFKTFMKNPNKESLEKMWKICRDLYNQLKNDIENTAFIDVPSLSPDLASVQDIDIAVPGTYFIGQPVITISLVGRSMEVLRSKQHPKRLCVKGSNGLEYWFLLKGHEDLRLDQRAMQIFDLINALFGGQVQHIVTYHVMPISLGAGLISWINGSDTIAKVVRDYRTNRGIPVDEESRLVSEETIPQIDSLLPIQRYEALVDVANKTSDTVLSDAIWFNSTTSEKWLQKTKTFCQTAAVMSIAGYMLGLGDRHPSNIMISQLTGTVVHIDLGDCFEVAKTRVMFPELIPFRLTRFMVRALGPCGVDGAFKTASKAVIKTIRGRRESIMAILEIFVHSPLSSEFSKIKREEPSISVFLDDVEAIAEKRSEEESSSLRTVRRIADKLGGLDFGSEKLSCEMQVDKLIEEATDYYNFAHLYRGWNPLW
ncbi:PIKK family atypical protein kinase [Trichomonas vaginalis G3]|uniref:non-specific serine/threonine protein kinase n=1 Tax=Trichomonas vaginalis (strain ATCC PRA-98 / G3) TaxID=412133 RepID=A2FB39_TRIV3|nr:ataxia telangiectasia mutated (ATM) -related family [Trichomonas vaginalis G3]EAX97874.1 PIKK family atypical protein kinase [Trichomonas vaginalis G3]KAI5501154.1 ataxia telangiectasia mutated (ATM) -related family [Trichomonas vaginalis G3]|eukprot:XP_001310804.1 PIKK family atypical protein kinase [Trichomonas vaginalis G3]